ncbi:MULTISPECIES: RdgB/HAM1 family non-canonical purine NTP pyrophosphatase [Leptolyngbya]|jgi:XTP/dITP diphosphohydrolase|uniref:dITP/XTP pyrophosphatase n=1 Tax=Leptolyngbya boryana NIES-2135 TaxID=1973484 RepID=A0A1Z4JKX4_LEPBY|nr:MULTISPECIES: RdgB/HAM1 family non-canonical purine NTP pyrophosphatase [Leptolyngbya]BAY57366.1 RdgB/HAM1 family non-canonical purine NTP pyrophosphatase [Leptolyngbya boryana NIES-2135]MBD2368694.1 RdgB/HAM1 family non-canonical purine NTP pyrophosphatase [Leptolyngbya sp. FACHB-161]MBD2375045.1 RdgB/HAM1 family non-canonical purine NTP pyrophosphatase [Leptolyngbya sp. FACHB-238]MBD2399464.1 RdgB/HAM1 family non-canonical purine NTP pyrophosphatase [Leptolyngbya sp. FACHB-239]MBD2405670.
MTVLVVATGNPGKVKEIEPYLSGLNWELRLKPPELEMEETGTTFQENAAQKATQVAIATGQWAIADDSGLEVMALDGRPGVYSARYAESDQARIAKLLGELGDATDRRAQFVCAIAVAKPDGTIALLTEGFCPGEILTAPRGEGGFGYDPIFYVPEQRMTFSEMPLEVKQEISHRGRAFQAILPQMKALKV